MHYGRRPRYHVHMFDMLRWLSIVSFDIKLHDQALVESGDLKALGSVGVIGSLHR